MDWPYEIAERDHELQNPTSAEKIRLLVAAPGLQSLIEVHTTDGASFPIEPESWDAALCLGATFVWGTMAAAAAALVPP